MNPEGNVPIENVPSSAWSDPGRERSEAPVMPEKAAERVSEQAHEKYRQILSKVTGNRKTGTDDDYGTIDADAEAVYAESDVESRVTRLLSIAETKGPEYAVRVAIRLNDLCVLDRFHDEMTERFYDALVAKGVIRP